MGFVIHIINIEFFSCHVHILRFVYVAVLSYEVYSLAEDNIDIFDAIKLPIQKIQIKLFTSYIILGTNTIVA
jgi:hypothetical protein